ncbi:MAG: lipopolysaccharide heptosyltransferase family protein [Candidatus Eisenbacteria bacterium]|nr:lipopolysaccharide heptosyltransferase family protein [Candidatus Latescibacterota bacterium]MBD3302658.1 lipopolysaccharide heptosyltransferase family protein [Candidatus Eisenbacteria bacterium]
MHEGTVNLRCRLFNGYRPCFPRYVCEGCTEAQEFDSTILLINLDAMGDVLMTTCQLRALRKRHPDALLTWVTLPGHRPLLEHNPLIDRVWAYDFSTVSILQAMEFDLLLNADKGRASCALAETVRAKEKRGFGMNRTGAVVPLNAEAATLYRLGIDDHEKFVVNRRTGQDLLAEAFLLPYERDPYVLELTPDERRFVAEYRERLGIGPEHPAIGVQTGASDLYPLKSLTQDQLVDLIGRIQARLPEAVVLLLGGPAEHERNEAIARRCHERVVKTPTREGLRRGIQYLDACDVVVSPDTGALHIAIARGKWTVGWFNVSCAQEIDLFDRGVKVTTPLDCSPCWRRECPDPICLPMADLDAIVEGVVQGIEKIARR